jgi:hypothetical protein
MINRNIGLTPESREAGGCYCQNIQQQDTEGIQSTQACAPHVNAHVIGNSQHDLWSTVVPRL